MVVALATPGESDLTAVHTRLETWQRDLGVHFDALHLGRLEAGDWPVFGLEHGLDPAQVEALKGDVRAQIRRTAPRQDTWLPWVVYAAELGYAYSGNEYWQTFEAETPGWLHYGHRQWIRACFARFHVQCGGIKPTGDWAEWFSIISGPIANAVLPRDLQYQLAKVLYELRYTPDTLASAETLGAYIRRRAIASSASNRFKEFTQDSALVGQIGFALLFQGEEHVEALLLQRTLQRIVADLELAQGARNWLQGARRNAQRIHVRGLAPVARLATPASIPSNHWRDDVNAGGNLDAAREAAASLAIEPRLLLRPTGRDSWEVRIQIPDLSPIAPRFPGARELLENSTSRVAGCAARPLARGQLVSPGGVQAILSRWPAPAEVLLEFARPVPPELAFLLRCDCLLRPGPRWLFRVAQDGRAYEVRTLVVRPGQRYVLLSTGAVPAELDSKPVSVSCDGIQGIEFEVPIAVSGAREAYYGRLGVQVSHQAEVWPAGLVAARWDNEGYAEWLDRDEVCLGIRANHEVASLLLQLDGEDGTELELHPSEPGETAFIAIPTLAVGTHRLLTWLLPVGEAEYRPLGQLEIRVRETRRWEHGLSDQNALFVTVDPPSPSMEQVCANSVLVDVQGPMGTTVHARIAFVGPVQSDPLPVLALPDIQVPVTAEDWRLLLQERLRGDPQFKKAERLAVSCSIELDAGDVGHFNLLCERADRSLRWVLLDATRPHRLMLLNPAPAPRSWAPEPLRITRYRFDSPQEPHSIAAADLAQPWNVDDSGGLFVAYNYTPVQALGHPPGLVVPGRKASVIVPPAVTLFQGKPSIRPRFEVRSLGQAKSVLHVLRRWNAAETYGNPVSLWAVQQVERAGANVIFRHIVGDSWGRAEADYLRSSGDDQAVKLFCQSIVTRERPDTRLAWLLGSQCSELASAAPHKRAHDLGTIARRTLPLGFNVRVKQGRAAGLAWLAEFALRLASAPATVPGWSGQDMTIGLSTLVAVPALARAARFLVLYVERACENQAPSSPVALYAGWEWE